jgi:hypothetical protein
LQVWTSAIDKDPSDACGPTRTWYGVYLFWGLEEDGESKAYELDDWTLMVPSDLELSGPVLLLAARKGVPLTPRMQGMLGEVQRRALAFVGSFHMASRLSRAPGAGAPEWEAMARMPVDVLKSIATLAKLSIAAVELVP